MTPEPTIAPVTHTKPAPGATHQPLATLLRLVEALAARGIDYCHWKSNYHLHFALAGIEDFDVLIRKQHFPAFLEVLAELDFRPAESITSRDQPGVFHYLGTDVDSGLLLNVHAYTRILTGDHLLKSWALPFERMLLDNLREHLGAKVPTASAELIVFVLRHAIKHTTPVDLLLLRRSESAVREEFAWLTDGLDTKESHRHLAKYFPEIDPQLFDATIAHSSGKGSVWSGIGLGWRMRKALAPLHLRYGFFTRQAKGAVALGRIVANRLWFKQKHMTFQTGGAVIALVGPQATGKSTIAGEIRRWLGCELSIRYVHVGKPPATLLTFIPTKLVPLARKLFPKSRTRNVDQRAEVAQTEPTQAKAESFNFPYLFLIRKLMLAHDRRSLLRKVFRSTRNGKLVLCDRYPSDELGAIDGPSFRPEMIEAQTSGLKRALMKRELRIYEKIAPPDWVLSLTVSVEEAVRRNLLRNKDLPQDTAYVQQRHAMTHQPRFERCEVVEISTARDLDATLADVRKQVWKRL